MRALRRTSMRRAGQLVVAFALTFTLAAADATAAEPIPSSAAAAQAVLDRFVGSWKTQATIKNSTSLAREIVAHGKAECRRTLEGNWWEFRTETVPPGESDLQIMTFDAPRGVYRQWVFSSDGYFHAAEGTWDASSSTPRWTGTTPTGKFAINDHWVSADRLEWNLRRTDAQGRRAANDRGDRRAQRATLISHVRQVVRGRGTEQLIQGGRQLRGLALVLRVHPANPMRQRQVTKQLIVGQRPHAPAGRVEQKVLPGAGPARVRAMDVPRQIDFERRRG